MTLVVHTARIGTRDPDAFDVTRKSGDRTFAPSDELFLRMFRLKHRGLAGYNAWRDYCASYAAEMERSRATHPARWEALLARERVVLTCYCDHGNCHRVLLARILATLGARYDGELE